MGAAVRVSKQAAGRWGRRWRLAGRLDGCCGWLVEMVPPDTNRGPSVAGREIRLGGRKPSASSCRDEVVAALCALTAPDTRSLITVREVYTEMVAGGTRYAESTVLRQLFSTWTCSPLREVAARRALASLRPAGRPARVHDEKRGLGALGWHSVRKPQRRHSHFPAAWGLYVECRTAHIVLGHDWTRSEGEVRRKAACAREQLHGRRRVRQGRSRLPPPGMWELDRGGCRLQARSGSAFRDVGRRMVRVRGWGRMLLRRDVADRDLERV